VRWTARSTVTSPEDATQMRGLLASPVHDQSFLNHSVGSKCNGAAYAARLVALMRTSMSVGDAFAYSTTTSK
jgi:hypothetical protein